MSETWFSDNYGDLCKSSGVEAGFQFEFYCERCRNAFRTEFEPFRGGQAAGWLERASGFMGGVLGGASNAAEGLATSAYGKTRDEKFREAIVEAKQHFKRCAQCFQYMCQQCFDDQSGLCYNCAPDAEVAAQASRAEGKAQAARDAAYKVGQDSAASMDVATPKQLRCPDCGSETHGAKFCPECGAKLAVTSNCPGCGAEVAPGAKFCPECGQKMA